MSAAFRTEIESLLDEAEAILATPKSFNVPLKGPTQSNAQFNDAIQASLADLNLEFQNLCEIADDLSQAHTNWMSLRSSMTGPERMADNSIYDQFYAQHPYMEALTRLKQYKRHLRSAQRLFEGALPSASAQSTSHAHIPKMNLPSFSGKSADFLSFWNQFSAAIGNISSLSDAVKLSYLKSCLAGPSLATIESLPLTDDSYGQAVQLLKNKFDNKEEIIRSLYQAIRNLPTVRKGENFNEDFATLTDNLESILIQFRQHNSDFNNPSILMDIECKLPDFVLEEVYKTKEQLAGHWTTEDLKECLKNIRKRREEINAVHPSIPTPQSPNVQQSPPLRLDTPVSNRNSLPFNRSLPTRNLQQIPPLTLSALALQQNHVNPGFRHPCLFCNDFGHITTYCEKFPDYNSRISRLNELKLCSRCLKPNHNFKNCPIPSQCKNCNKMHPRPLCYKILAKFSQKTNICNNQTHTSNYAFRNCYENNTHKQPKIYETNQVNTAGHYCNSITPQPTIIPIIAQTTFCQANRNFSPLPPNPTVETKKAAEFSSSPICNTIYRSHSYFNHNYRKINKKLVPSRPSVVYSTRNPAIPTPTKYKMKRKEKTKMKQQKLITTANNTLTPTIIKTTTTSNHPPINTTPPAKLTFCNNKFRIKHFLVKEDLASKGNYNFFNENYSILNLNDRPNIGKPGRVRLSTTPCRPLPLMSLNMDFPYYNLHLFNTHLSYPNMPQKNFRLAQLPYQFNPLTPTQYYWNKRN